LAEISGHQQPTHNTHTHTDTVKHYLNIKSLFLMFKCMLLFSTSNRFNTFPRHKNSWYHLQGHFYPLAVLMF